MGAWDIVKIIMQILGGMGTFLVGMRILSENMTKLAHGKLQKMLNKTAKSRFAGVGIGTAMTILGQSSAFTTVMVVGLVNAGIMTLFQATAIIMGANIGTTLNAWVIALAGSDITVFFLALAAVGVLLTMFSKNERTKSVGNVIAAFGLIFVGLKLMSGALSFQNGSEEFNAVSRILSAIKNPFLLLLIGIVITALVQSSTAVNAIIITMASLGIAIGGGGNSALYIIIGSNIGTCVTALISSLGASPNAKRAALIHFLFNFFGAILFMIILLCWTGFADTVLAAIFPSDIAVFGTTGLGPTLQIATFHTLFNVINTLLFLPFIKGFVWVAEHLVREKKPEQAAEALLFSDLDERLLRSPSVALGHLYQETGKAFTYAMNTMNDAFEAFLAQNVSEKERVDRKNAELAQMNRTAVAYLVKLSSSSLMLEEERTVSSLHYVLNDIMRIGELADNITKYTEHYVDDALIFSEDFLEMLKGMYDKLKKLYVVSLATFLFRDFSKLAEVDALEDEIDKARRDLVASHIARLNEGKCQPQNSNVSINLVGNLERAADHITYIAHSIEQNQSL